MMKRLALLCLCVLVFSCSKIHENNRTSPTLQDQKVNLYITTTFSNLDLQLRSESLPSVDIDAADLIYSNGIRVVLYSVNEQGEPDAVTYVFDKDIKYNPIKRLMTGLDITNYNTDNNSLTLDLTPVRITPNNYKLLVINTPNEDIKERTSVGQTFERLKEVMPVIYETGGANEGKYYSYFYSNADDLVTITREELLKKSGSSHSFVTIRENHAYVTVDWEDRTKQEGDHVSNKSLVIYRDVCNRKFLLYPSFQTINGSNHETLKYPIDPNFSNLSSLSEDDLAEEFYYNDLADLHDGMTIDKSNPTNLIFLRIPENTTSGDYLNGQVITRIILEVTYAPKGINLGESWIAYGGKYYSPTEFQQLYETAIKARDHQSKALVKEVAKMKELNNGQLFPENKGMSYGEIHYYYHGKCYYAVPIKHFKQEDLADGEKNGTYGVVRGTYYKINIKKFNHAGVPSPVELSRDIDYTNIDHTFPSISFIKPNIVEYDTEV